MKPIRAIDPFTYGERAVANARTVIPQEYADEAAGEAKVRVWAAEIWVRYAFPGQHDFPPTIDELRANMRRQQEFARAFRGA